MTNTYILKLNQNGYATHQLRNAAGSGRKSLPPLQHIGLNAKLGRPQVLAHKYQLLVAAVSDNKTKQVLRDSCILIFKKNKWLACILSRIAAQRVGAATLVACCGSNIVQTSGPVGT